MKMILAIISKSDEDEAITALTKAGYYVTRLATTGGFLKNANVTLLIGTDDEKVPGAMELIKKNCGRRVEMVPYMAPAMNSSSSLQTTPFVPVPQETGGAVVFVLNVDEFVKFNTLS